MGIRKEIRLPKYRGKLNGNTFIRGRGKPKLIYGTLGKEKINNFIPAA